MTARNPRATPRLLCLALVSLMFLSTAPLLSAASDPVAVMAPDDLTVQVGDAVTLTGEGSYCPRGNITSYIWDMGDGTRLFGVNVTHAYSATGTYTVTLVVMADDGAYDTVTGKVIVVDRTWTARIGSATTDDTSYAPGETINATVVVERGPDSLTAVWQGALALAVIDGTGDSVHTDTLEVWLPSGGDVQTLTFQFSLDGAGDYVLRLSLYWMNATWVDGKDLNITVKRDHPNNAPVASVDPATQLVEVGADATLHGSALDPDGDVVDLLWDLGDGTSAEGVQVTHAYRLPGTYNVTLLVTDEHGATGVAHAIVEVVDSLPLPGGAEVWIDDFSTDKDAYQVGEVIEVTIVVERGPDLLDHVWEGTLVLTRVDPDSEHEPTWSLPVTLPGGGATQTLTFSVTPYYAGPLALVATLYWMDGSQVDSLQVNLTVTDQRPNAPPEALIDPDDQTVDAGDTVRLDGSLSRDPDGRIVSHLWDLGDGTSAEGAQVSHVYRLPGVYNVTLRVTDDDGAVAVAHATVTVLAVAPPREAWIVSIAAKGTVNGSEAFNVDVDVIRGDDMLDYVWLGALVLQVIDGDGNVVLSISRDVELATGGEARTLAFQLSLPEAGDHVLRATLLRFDGTEMDVEETTVTVMPPPDGNDDFRPAPDEGRLPDVPAPAVAAAGLLVILGALGATEAGKFSLLGLLVPLYTKLKRDEVLDHFTRGKIYGYILANPGDHYNSIQKAVDVPNGTFAYHLHVLEKEGYIRSVRDGMNRLFFPAGMKIPPREGNLRAGQRLIVEKILEEPGISQKEIAASLGVSPSTVSYHIRDLLEMGVVETERRGMSLRCYINRDLLSSTA